MPKDHWKSERDKEARQKRARDIRQQKEREAEERSFTQTGPVDLSEDVQQRHHEESRLRLKKTALGKFRPDVARGSKAPTHFSGEFLVNPFGLTADILADALKTAGSTNADGITKAILAQKDFKVPGAIFYEWKDRYPSVSAAVVGFDAGGAFRQIELIDPRTIK